MNNYNERQRVAVQDTDKIVAAERSVSMGPIPTAEEFAKYKEVLPDLPERIVAQFEADSVHLRELQKNAQNASIRYDLLSLGATVLLIVLGLGAVLLLESWGKDEASIVAGLGTVGLIFKGLLFKKK